VFYQLDVMRRNVGATPLAFTEAKKYLCSSASVNANGAAPPAICHPERMSRSPERSEGEGSLAGYAAEQDILSLQNLSS